MLFSPLARFLLSFSQTRPVPIATPGQLWLISVYAAPILFLIPGISSPRIHHLITGFPDRAE